MGVNIFRTFSASFYFMIYPGLTPRANIFRPFRPPAIKSCAFLSILLISCSFLIGQENQVAIVPQNALKDVVHEMIDSAEKEILIAHFILLNDNSGLGVINHLILKARAGVKVRVIIDGVGAYSNQRLTKKNLQEIAQAGIEIKVYHPKWRCFYKIRKRMHDKILIVDEKALIGSSSFWDVSFDRWQVETDILLQGKVLATIKEHFEELWKSKEVYAVKKKEIKIPKYLGIKTSFQKVLNDLNFTKVESLDYWSDGIKKEKGKGSFQKTLDLINQAQKVVIVVNPYFLPVKSLDKVLKKAHDKGVKIEVYTNSAEVLALEYKMLGVAYSRYDKLFKKWGITVYEAPEKFGMIHSKIILVDGKKLYIGGQNLDPLGAKHNTENGVCFESKEMTDWFRNELKFYQENFISAFQDGAMKRKPYTIKNKWKWHWRKTLAICLKSVL